MIQNAIENVEHVQENSRVPFWRQGKPSTMLQCPVSVLASISGSTFGFRHVKSNCQAEALRTFIICHLPKMSAFIQICS